MIAASKPTELIDNLAEKHLAAVNAQLHWTAVWQVFSDDPWFNRRLNDSANYLIKRWHLPRQNKEDVQQEALVQFARSIERDASLGFRPERGDFGAFLGTIINRCCQKGLRQFRHSNKYSITNESQHPYAEEWAGLDEQIDLRESIGRVPEPFRSTVRLVCDGLSIAQIAKRKKKSERTVYRWLEKGIEHLRVICAAE